jgi:hypothetical protein
MADERFSDREKLRSIGNLKKKDWLSAAERLGLRITQPTNRGTSHFAIRKADHSIPVSDTKGLVAVVYDGMNRTMNKKAFVAFLDEGFSEQQIWEALGR